MIMKKLIPFIFCVLFSLTAFAQGGVDFQNLTFDEALAKAKAEKKLVFLDAYTSWCGPCKHMAKFLFPRKEAGDFFNPRFVSVKFDMEKGEGVALGQRLGVKAYPTFVIIRPDGTVLHRIVGQLELDELIKRVNRGVNPKTSLHYLAGEYEKGKLDKKQMMAYKQALDDGSESEMAQKVWKELIPLLTEKDKLKKEFFAVFEDEGCTLESPDFKFLLANLPVIEKNAGKERVGEYLYRFYDIALTLNIRRREGPSHFSPHPAKNETVPRVF